MSMLKYTICFVIRGSRVLMLNRSKPPGMGCWNGVGGKIEPGETPEQGAIREIREETGIEARELYYAGQVTWFSALGTMSGAHLFVAELPEHADEAYAANEAPQETEEGLLAWKEIEWLLDERNKGLISHLHLYLRSVLERTGCYAFECYFNDQGQVMRFEQSALHKMETTGA
ncbi:NADH pyrophosphatase [Paenibacillus solanacearum]|uniref:NADH pyrophosphatase n=1 Tax=Paenibacillus solanacearum TaxID=2048548 RepID=A0A916NR33_9BACL|nr:8-oxo-dGTP diphosphatase [Paenibacillus solanacearum]CAG7635700.1 NADH pyrophosphatase [Paenibacillus solanacearum]